ncbi:MAG: hypothetical protein JWP97_6549 [Labilithrix sp.]|nr:hypothetical protein [Labilithrix sp.]
MKPRRRLLRWALRALPAGVACLLASTGARAQGEPPIQPSPAAEQKEDHNEKRDEGAAQGRHLEKKSNDEAAGSQPAEEASGSQAAVTPVPEGGTSPKRAVPDYDGRGPEPTTAGDVSLWIPRVLLSPLYVVSEYVIRRPLGLLLTTAERNNWPEAVRNFFTFGPEKKAGILPTAFLDLGFRPSVGIYAFWDDLLGPGNHLRLHFSTFGPDWVQAAVADKIPVGKSSFFDIRVEGVHRPDQVFHGLGPESRQANRSRYGLDMLQARPVFETTWWKGSRVTIEGGLRYVDFRDDACCSDPSVVTRVREGTLVAPPGFADGYTAAYERGELTIDSRDQRPASQTGVRLEVYGEQGSNVRRAADNWVKYGGSLGGFVDVKNNRTVSLSVTTMFVDPLSARAVIPFTEQVVLGGSGPMRGYLYGRLIDRSAAVATFKYRWPIWVFLDGSIQAAVGNVFGPQLENFKPDLLRFSSSVGVESVGTADHTFEVLVGLGTETFASGANVNSARLLFGTNRGF